eukprot:COSAG01_NODE_18874_length_1047_cov_1.763713_1_plen_137_part_00
MLWTGAMGGCYGRAADRRFDKSPIWLGRMVGARTSALLMVFCWTRLRMASRSIPSATVSRAAGMAAAVATIIAAIRAALILGVSTGGWGLDSKLAAPGPHRVNDLPGFVSTGLPVSLVVKPGRLATGAVDLRVDFA